MVEISVFFYHSDFAWNQRILIFFYKFLHFFKPEIYQIITIRSSCKCKNGSYRTYRFSKIECVRMPQLSEVLLMTRKNLLWSYIWMNWAFYRIFGLVAFILVKVGYNDKVLQIYRICLNSSVGRVLHFCAKGPRFKSGWWHFFSYIPLFFQNN